MPESRLDGPRLAARPVTGMLRLSGSALLLAGLLTAVAAALQATAWPPSTSEALPEWVESHHLALALIDECLGISGVLLAVGMVGLWQQLHAARRPAIGAGIALIALSAPVSLFLVAIHGRLIYPAYGIDVASDPQNLALVVTIWAGGAHMVSLTLMIAGLTIGIAMLRDRGRRATLGALGIAAGGTQLLVAFPWLFPVAVVTACQIILATWFAALGVSMFQHSRR
jgi:hypothetical protein